MDFSKLDMEIIEKEILTDRQSKEVVNEGGGVNATDETAMDPSPSNSVWSCERLPKLGCL